MNRRSQRPVIFHTLLTLGGCLLTVMIWFAITSPVPAQDFSPASVPVYVGDFELSSAAAVAPPPQTTAADTSKKTPQKKDGPATVFEPSDNPSVQARRLMDFIANNLVEEFQKAGYTASRQRGNSRPDSGVLLRGVFGEADALNRIRRAMLGGGTVGARLLLYVGTFNLARPDQPLYQPAATQDQDSRFGPVISLNNYIPLAKFELSKNPTEDEVKRISRQIVQNLSTLLKTNPASFGQ